MRGEQAEVRDLVNVGLRRGDGELRAGVQSEHGVGFPGELGRSVVREGDDVDAPRRSCLAGVLDDVGGASRLRERERRGSRTRSSFAP